MAQISEEMIVIKVSTLVRNDAGETPPTFSDDIVETLEAAISDLVGQGKIVEVIRDI